MRCNPNQQMADGKTVAALKLFAKKNLLLFRQI